METEEPLLKMRGRIVGIGSDIVGGAPSPKLLDTINGLARRPSFGDVGFPEESMLDGLDKGGCGLSGTALGGDPNRCMMFSSPISGLGLGWECASSEGDIASEDRGDFKRGESGAAGLVGAARGRPPERRLAPEDVV